MYYLFNFILKRYEQRNKRVIRGEPSFIQPVWQYCEWYARKIVIKKSFQFYSKPKYIWRNRKQSQVKNRWVTLIYK
jgi:hypothetical protein